MTFLREKPLVGVETEFFLIDDKGRVSNSADSLLRKTNLAKKECGKNMIEVLSDPYYNVAESMKDLIRKVKAIRDITLKNDKDIWFYGTYPGNFQPKMRTDREYRVKEKLFGPVKFRIAGRCIGMHCHYTLPRGIFDPIEKTLNILVGTRLNRRFIDSYNMFIAMDPVLTTFMQSSPFYQGKFYGKDSRTIFYRGDEFFGVDGLYTKYQNFGGLPDYELDNIDILEIIEDRFDYWLKLIKKLGLNIKTINLYKSTLDTNWGPIKVSPHGTLEHRGMDINRFDLVASCALVIKQTMRTIKEKNLKVKISPIGIKDPFKVEGNSVYIPPFDYVRYIMQFESAVHGLKSKAVLNYCKGLMKMIGSGAPIKRKKIIRPFSDMVNKKRTVSDEIIRKVRMTVGNVEKLTNKEASDVALLMMRNIDKNIDKTEKMLDVYND